MTRTPRTAIKAAAFFTIALLPGFVRGQQQNASDKRAPQAAPAKAISPEDAEIQQLQEERKRLLKQKEIEKLRKENEQLAAGGEKPPTAQAAPPAKTLSPEDAELQRLEEERKKLIKEQEIEKLRKQNEALKAPAPPAPPVAPPTPKPNCTPQAQGPKVGVKVPPKASAWACKTLGVCADDKPIEISGGNGCPATPAK